MFFSRKRQLRLSDLSENDKAELSAMASLVNAPDAKAREYLEARIGVPISVLQDFESYLEVGSKKVWASFRACHLTGNILVSSQFKLQKVGKDGTVGEELDNSTPPGTFLRMPNPNDSWEEMIYQWTFHMKLTGKAYWLKDEINGAGQPLNVYPLLPQYVEIEPNKDTKVGAYIYKVNGVPIRMLPEEMIEFRRPHPASFIKGLGDVEAGTDLFQLYMTRNEPEGRFLENGAQPSGILTKKEMVQDEDRWASFVAKWKALYQGRRNAGKTAFLNGDWTYLKLGLTQQEMQAIEREKWTIEQIFLCHGVPLSVAGLEGAANYATAKQDEINFRKYECVPLLDLLVGKLNSTGGLAPAYGEDIRFSYDLDGLIDVEQVIKDYAPMVRIGALTPNELREKAGLDQIDNPFMDQLFIEQGLVPLEMAGMTGESITDDEIKSIVTGGKFGKRVRKLRTGR